MGRVVASLIAWTFLFGACGSDADHSSPDSTTSSTTIAASTTSAPTTTRRPTTSTPTMTVTTTTVAPLCDPRDVTAVLDAALVDARIATSGDWQAADGDAPVVADTADPDRWAAALGLDCGAHLVDADASSVGLALIAWTGPRAAFVIRTTGRADPPPQRSSTISVGFENPVGEFVRVDRSLWVGELESGETLVVGHIDFNLGITAKTFSADAPSFGEPEIVLESEQVAIDVVTAAGGRNATIAQPPEFGSLEGYVSFVSPTGQILVVDVAPAGWFDPMQPRYYTGATTMLDVDGTTVRVTEPAGEEGAYTVGVEVAWACADHVWILEPTSNGTGDEMVAFVETLIAANDCGDSP